jgi:ribonuclease P protein component
LDHRLKSKITIDKIFAEGKSAFVYPIKLAYLSLPKNQYTEICKYGVSVSKRNFKLAVDRNRIKRQMREAIRLQYSGISGHEGHVTMMMFIFAGKEKLEYDIIERAIKKLLKKIK